MSGCHDYQKDLSDGERYCSRCGVQEAAEGEVVLVYSFRGEILAICETMLDAKKFIASQKALDPSEFYTEKWKVKYYE